MGGVKRGGVINNDVKFIFKEKSFGRVNRRFYVGEVEILGVLVERERERMDNWLYMVIFI